VSAWSELDAEKERDVVDHALADLDWVAKNRNDDVAYAIARGMTAIVHELRAIHADNGRTVA
jgi:hypothetical protein